MTNLIRPLTAALSIVAAAGLAGTGAAPVAAAETAAVTVDFRCTYPLIGPRPLSVAISTSLPSTIQAGTPTPPVQVEAVATISADTTPGMVTVGSKSLEGSAVASASITGPSVDLPLEVSTTLEPTPVPASGAFDTVARASIEPITFPAQGTYQITLDDLLLTITPRDAAGRTTGLDTFDSDCALEPGQDTVIATVAVTQGPTPTDPPTQTRAYHATGSTYLSTPRSTAPLRASLEATYETGSGAVAGDLAVEPATATIRMFGFFPATAKLQLVPTGRLTGTLSSGVLNTTASIDVRVPSVTFFGFPVAGGSGCHTTQPTTIPLQSAAAFDPAAGGLVTGTYDLPAFTRCGGMTDALTQALSGAGNTLRLTLAPSA